MSDLWQPFVELVGSWLPTYLIHSTILLIGAWTICRRLGGRRLAIQERLWKVAVTGGLVTALLQTGVGLEPALGSWSLPLPMAGSPAAEHTAALPAPARASVQSLREPTIEPVVVPPAEAVFTTSRATTPTTAATELGRSVSAASKLAENSPRILPLLWVIGAVTLALFLVLSHLALVRRLGDRSELVDGRLRTLLDGWLAALRTPRRVRLFASRRISVPLARGVFQAEICLPSRMLDELPQQQQQSVLAHELAHLKRRDPAWLLALRLIESIFFVQPLNRVARKRLQAIAEYRCDDWAVARTGQPLALARSLTEVAGWRAAGPALPAPALAAQRSGLHQRVRRLLDYEAASDRLPRWSTPLAVSVLTLTVLAAPGITSAARSQQEAPPPPVADADSAPPPPMPAPPADAAPAPESVPPAPPPPQYVTIVAPAPSSPAVLGHTLPTLPAPPAPAVAPIPVTAIAPVVSPPAVMATPATRATVASAPHLAPAPSAALRPVLAPAPRPATPASAAEPQTEQESEVEIESSTEPEIHRQIADLEAKMAAIKAGIANDVGEEMASLALQEAQIAQHLEREMAKLSGTMGEQVALAARQVEEEMEAIDGKMDAVAREVERAAERALEDGKLSDEEKEALRAAREEMQEELARAREEIRRNRPELEAARELMRAELARVREKLERSRPELEAVREQMRAEMARVREELERQRPQLEAAREQMRAAHSRIDEEKLRQLRELHEEMTELRSQLRDGESERRERDREMREREIRERDDQRDRAREAREAEAEQVDPDPAG